MPRQKPAPTTPAPATPATASSNPTYGMAALAYVFTWLTGLIVFLTADKNDKYTRFHGLQAIGLGIVLMVVFLLLQFVVVGLFLTGAGTAAIGSLVMLLVWAGVIVVIVLCAVKAYKGQKFMLPFIGGIAEKNA